MRHLRRTAKLGRTGSHRNAMLANLVCSLIKHKRITTTLAKAKATRPVAEKLLTLGKHAQAAIATAGTATDETEKKKATAANVHYRRLAAARLRQHGRTQFAGSKQNPGKAKRELFREQEDVVHILFDKIAPLFKDRSGGYTRILRVGTRRGDVAQMAILEWVELPADETAVTTEAKPAEAAK
jgi:large subunit ribosomal protein L17